MLLQKTSAKVLLADDHPLIVLGLKNAIKQLLPNASFFEAVNGSDALKFLRENRDIDLSIIDVNMPELNGLDLLSNTYKVLKHNTKTIILTLHKDLYYYETSKSLGASGYLLKEHALTELQTCLQKVLNNESYLSPAMHDMLQTTNTTLSPVQKLNSQELELLKLIGGGKSQKEISQIMVISSKSTTKSMTKICHKLEIPENENSLKAWVLENKFNLTY